MATVWSLPESKSTTVAESIGEDDNDDDDDDAGVESEVQEQEPQTLLSGCTWMNTSAAECV